MFFAFNENPYSWGGMKMQAHVDVMEALELTGGNNDTVEEMKLWLLKQKQTQQWNSPVATADAVYALLMKGRKPARQSGRRAYCHCKRGAGNCLSKQDYRTGTGLYQTLVYTEECSGRP